MDTLKKFKVLYLILTSILFILLTFAVKSGPNTLDLQILELAQKINIPFFTEIMTILTFSGWGIPLYILLGIIFVIAYVLGRKKAALFTVLLALTEYLLFASLSTLINRPRPPINLIKFGGVLSGGGYPSGHVLMYTILFGFLIYLTSVHLKNTRLKLKIFLISVYSLLIVLIGVARIYSGQHWPSDVLAGYLVGSIVVVIFSLFYNNFKNTQSEE